MSRLVNASKEGSILVKLCSFKHLYKTKKHPQDAEIFLRIMGKESKRSLKLPILLASQAFFQLLSVILSYNHIISIFY
jgi:hypothetical protein